jgi:hypothetical protein
VVSAGTGPGSADHDRHVDGEAAIVRRVIGEEALVDGAPVLQRPVALALTTGVIGVDLVEGDDIDVRHLDQGAGVLGPVEHDREIADPGERFALVLVVPLGAGGGRLGAVEHETDELLGLLGRRTERPRRRGERLPAVGAEVAGDGIGAGLVPRGTPEGVDLLGGHLGSLPSQSHSSHRVGRGVRRRAAGSSRAGHARR